MRTFYCDHCGNLVFFENVQCLKCGHALGFLPEPLDLTALEPDKEGWRALAAVAGGERVRLCRNGQDHQVCNWLVPVAESDGFCRSCRLNQVIPDLTVAGNLERWHKMEQAKRRLVYTLLQLGLPLAGNPERAKPPLQFRFLADTVGGAPVLTGHNGGVITLNLAEADDAERERRRVQFHEPYRTLLGHFRHESAHYFWERLIAGTPWLDRFRDLFGDETQDYAAALRQYHQQGPPGDWQNRLVSAYAAAHPWEDWAETWAHYLHIIDTLETAAGFGIALKPKHPDAKAMSADLTRPALRDGGFEPLFKTWVPLTAALNSLNRGMGLPDLYPFVLAEPAVGKLTFIHDLIRENKSRAAAALRSERGPLSPAASASQA